MKFKTSMIFKDLQDKTTEREPFNEELITFKEREDIGALFNSICKGLEIINGFQLVSVEVAPPKDIYIPKVKKKEDEDNPKKKKRIVKDASKVNGFELYPIEQNRYEEVTIKYRLTDTEQTVERTTVINYPELIDGQYYIINSNRFFPIFQLADAEFYRGSSNTIVLKTMFMGLSVKGDKVYINDHFNEMEESNIRLRARNAKLTLFKREIPAFNYYFAKMGMVETFKFFNVDNYIFTQELNEKEELDESKRDKYYYFKATKHLFLLVDKEWLTGDNSKANGAVLSGILECFNKNRAKTHEFFSKEYWVYRLGSKFTTDTSNAMNKAIPIMLSLERVIDSTTRNNLRVQDEDKKDVYHLLRYMILKFDDIASIDNHGLSNKRIRVAEYILYALIKKLSTSVYRLININQPTIKALDSIFSNIKKDYVTKRISGIDLIRYSGNSSSIDLFGSILKGSKGGPQNQSGGSSISSKGLNPSYIGRIDTTSTSSNDPGASFTVVPFCKIHDPNNNNNFFFTDEPDIRNFNNLEEEDDDVIEITEETMKANMMGGEDE